jgi:hypothetical protein
VTAARCGEQVRKPREVGTEGVLGGQAEGASLSTAPGFGMA